LRRSKTDNKVRWVGAVGIPALAKQWLSPSVRGATWFELAGITEGAVFRSFGLRPGRERTGELRDVARLVQAVTRRGHVAGDFGAHSLRAGFLTSAAQKKVPEVDIQARDGPSLHRDAAGLRPAGHALRRSTTADHHGPEMIRSTVPWRRPLFQDERISERTGCARDGHQIRILNRN
jgi:hypothetical protein